MSSTGIIILVVVVVILLFIIIQFNSIKSLQNKVKQSRSGIDVALEKRFDLIPNLIECVKGYCEHEEKVLTEITKARSEYLQNKSLANGEAVNNKCSDVLLLAEKYPALKASEQFLELQAQLERTESGLSAARRLYNSDVTMYNTKIQVFPASIIAGFMGAKPENFFEAEEAAKKNVKVQI